jgi:DNA-binding GntR family transcriptional regulator
MSSLKRERAYQCLRDAITFGTFKPGERVIEKTVCEMFILGRTPLREALRQLELEGYVEVLPNRGAVVRKVSAEDLEQVYDVLAVLEGHAVESAAGSMDRSVIKELKGIEEELIGAAREKDFKKWLDHNVRFHQVFQRVSGNTVLSAGIGDLRKRTYRYRALALSIHGHVEEYLSDHRKILEAAMEGKAVRAGQAMRRHVQRAGMVLVNFLRENPWV